MEDKIIDTTTLDGKRLYYSFLAVAQRIFDHQGYLNKINVFPVRDADTGTNLASTMRSIVDTFIPTDNITVTANALADAALIGARGNSGIIFAQFLYGFSTEFKNDETIPHEVLLVIDGNSGQNAVLQAKEFNKKTKLTGLVLTKLDSTAKGGVIFNISQALDVPIRFIGTGEQIDDLKVFKRDEFIDTLF